MWSLRNVDLCLLTERAQVISRTRNAFGVCSGHVILLKYIFPDSSSSKFVLTEIVRFNFRTLSPPANRSSRSRVSHSPSITSPNASIQHRNRVISPLLPLMHLHSPPSKSCPPPPLFFLKPLQKRPNSHNLRLPTRNDSRTLSPAPIMARNITGISTVRRRSRRMLKSTCCFLETEIFSL